MTSSPRFWANLGLLIVGSLGLAYALAAAAIARGSGSATTYAGHSVAAEWCSVTAGLALMAAGLVTIRSQPHVGALSIVAGFVWFAPIWEGWEGGPALARTIGMLATAFVFPVLVHLVLAAAGRPMSRAVTALVAATYLLVGLCAVVVVLIRDPYLDPYCWANCTTNMFDVSPRPEVAQQVSRAQLGIMALSALAITILCAGRLAKAFGARARRYWEVLPGGVLFGAATVAYSVLRRQHPLEDPTRTSYAVVFIIHCAAVTMIAVGLAAALLDARRVRRSVARIVATLHQAPPVGALDSALAQALGDPGLRVCYWLPASGQFADAHGHHVPDPSQDATVTTTPLVRNGQTVAVVAHHSDPAQLESGLGSAARLALDNERLQADLSVRMRELANSRARLVEAADVRRQSLERDLHDGAQQSLLGLSLDLRLARSTAEATGDDTLVALLDSAIGDVGQAFAELRELAHGIFPAVLAAAGLAPAIATLAASAPIPVDVDAAPDERLPLTVETAGYAVVARGLEVAASCSAHRAAVTMSRSSGVLVLDVTHDGREDVPDLVHIADRVGAVGGRLVVTPNRITAELPCAS